MDRMGIDIQAISVAPPQYYYWAEPDLGQKLARVQNDNLAEHRAPRIPAGSSASAPCRSRTSAPARTSSTGSRRTCGSPGRDLHERERRRLRSSRGSCRSSSDAGIWTSPWWCTPTGSRTVTRLAAYYLINTIGMPFDSTVFLARMIFGGVLERVPDIKMCVVHGRGYLPSYPSRYDHAWRERADVREFIPDHPPSTYLKRLHFDSVLYDAYELATLIERYGADHDCWAPTTRTTWERTIPWS